MTIYARLRAALAGVNLPLFLHAWTRSAAFPAPPKRYITYHEMLRQDELCADDAPAVVGHYLAVSLWSDGDTADTAREIRAALRGAGFLLRDEQDIYEEDTGTYHRAMTWAYYEDFEEGI